MSFGTPCFARLLRMKGQISFILRSGAKRRVTKDRAPRPFVLRDAAFGGSSG
jgi:hypothetical protein